VWLRDDAALTFFAVAGSITKMADITTNAKQKKVVLLAMKQCHNDIS
jgi:hypothetical protein